MHYFSLPALATVFLLVGLPRGAVAGGLSTEQQQRIQSGNQLRKPCEGRDSGKYCVGWNGILSCPDGMVSLCQDSKWCKGRLELHNWNQFCSCQSKEVVMDTLQAALAKFGVEGQAGVASADGGGGGGGSGSGSDDASYKTTNQDTSYDTQGGSSDANAGADQQSQVQNVDQNQANQNTTENQAAGEGPAAGAAAETQKLDANGNPLCPQGEGWSTDKQKCLCFKYSGRPAEGKPCLCKKNKRWDLIDLEPPNFGRHPENFKCLCKKGFKRDTETGDCDFDPPNTNPKFGLPDPNAAQA